MRPRGMPALAGVTDVALKIGKSKQWVDQVRRTNPGGPVPVAELAMGPVFVESDLLGFVQDPAHKPVKPREWPEEWTLVGRTEIAAMLGVKSTRADTRAKEPGFPEPVVVLRAGRAWLKGPVCEYLAIPRSMSHPRYVIDVDLAKRLYEGDDDTPGIGIQALAARLKVPSNVVRTRLVAAKVQLRTGDLRRTRTPVTPDEVEAIVEALAAPGATWHSVGVQVGRSPMTIQRIVLQHERDQAAAEAPEK